MDPRQRIVQWIGQRTPQQQPQCPLSSIPAVVFSFYADHVDDHDTTTRVPLQELASLAFTLPQYRQIYTYNNAAAATTLMVMMLSPLLKYCRRHHDGALQIRLVDTLRLNSPVFAPPMPLPVNGRLQYVFQINGVLRGVLMVSTASVEALSARCLIAMEFLAAQHRGEFAGPVFGVAFSMRAWAILEMPVHYARTEIAGDHRIRRFHADFDYMQDSDVELFLGTLHGVVMRAAAAAPAVIPEQE